MKKGQSGVLFGWCRVYGPEFLVQIDDNDVRRGARDGGGLEREVG